MKKISYCEAINEALIQEMERDENVFVYGIGVPDHKRIFGSTKNLLEKFGKNRCLDTPLSEDALTGMALGAAINGLRPVLVHARIDFLLLTVNQLANMVSSYRYASAGKEKVPLVIRAIIGRGWGQSCQHSKSMQSIFAHIPGLKVVMPTTPKDVKGLLISSIRDDNPVIFLEHRWLYYAEDEVPEKSYSIPIGKANIVKPGKDLTIIATSWMVVEALRAAEVLEKQGIKVEIVDPRSLTPFDEKTITESVNKTGHCIVADFDWIHCGFSAEIAARVSNKCFKNLKTPVERIGFAFTPCPSSRPLEDCFYPNAVDLIRSVEKKLNLEKIDVSNETFYSYERKFKGPF